MANVSRREFLAAAAAARLRLDHVKGEKVSFRHGERLLFEYRYAASRPKTYVHPLCAPDGSAITLDGPADHVHHRGVMLAWSDVNGFDFWGEVNPGAHGQMVHQRFERIGDRHVTAINHWIAEGKVLLIERQTVRALDPGWLEWESELKPARERVTLSAEKHVYNGLGVRFAHSLDRGGVLNARGTTDIKQANGEAAAWCAYHGPGPRGHPGGAIFDHPKNPRHPTPFFVMNEPYGYLSAAPTFREPFRLEPGQSLRLRYAVVAFTGAPGQLDRLYSKWAS
ncbi:MAG: PmoA family protein [Acidobacteriota bacterium]